MEAAAASVADDRVDPGQAEPAAVEMVDHLIDERLSLVELDERALDEDLVDSPEELLGPGQNLELSTLDVDFDQAGSRRLVSAEHVVKRHRLDLDAPDLVGTRECGGVLRGDRPERRGVAEAADMEARRSADARGSRVDDLELRVSVEDAPERLLLFSERLDAVEGRMRKPAPGEHGELASVRTDVHHRAEVVTERDSLVLDGSRDAVAKGSAIRSPRKQFQQLAGPPQSPLPGDAQFHVPFADDMPA